MCVSRCGATASVVDGRYTAIGPDPAHPTGRAVCVLGKSAPRILDHSDRLLQPCRRTAPKGASDPGWEQISWDQALDTIAPGSLYLALESDVLVGDGTGEHFTRPSKTTGVQTWAYSTNELTRCKGAQTLLTTAGENPTAWVFNHADLEVIDLTVRTAPPAA